MMTNRFFIYKWIIKNNWEKKKKKKTLSVVLLWGKW